MPPTILLLHGAWHSPEVWERVVSYLTSRGYRCLAPQLNFCATPEPIRSWQDCIDQIEGILSEEVQNDRDIILVNHSLSGIGGSSAVKGFTARDSSRVKSGTGRVIGMVGISTLAIRDAEHKMDVYKGFLSSGQHFEGGWRPPPEDAAEKLYNDLPPKDAQYWANKLMPTSVHLHESVEGVYAGFWDVPVWYVKCLQDKIFTTTYQDGYIAITKEQNEDVTVKELDSSHSPMLSLPSQTADIIHEAASYFEGKARDT